MKYPILCLLLAGAAAAPASAHTAPLDIPEPPRIVSSDEHEQAEKTATSAEPAEKDEAGKEEEDFDPAQFIKVFDKIFPAQPPPPAERLALARVTATGVFPDGTYAAIFEEMMGGLVERVLSLNPADFGKKEGEAVAQNATLRDAIAKDDPHFEERMRITRRVIGEELVKLSGVLEPTLRDGLARSIARRFDEAQLREINAFLATDSGKAFGSQTMRMWMDPDVMRSMMHTLPDLMIALPGAIERLEAETAHLPKPKKPEKNEAEAEEAKAEEAQAEEE